MKDSSSPVRYDVFLSDDSADKDAVAQIAARLRDDGVSPFLDKWCLVPGARWQERLREALLASQCAAVFFGTGGGGRWRDEELIATVAPLDAERFEREIRDLFAELEARIGRKLSAEERARHIPAEAE